MSLATGGSVAHRPKVLIVDDNEVCRAVASEMPAMEGDKAVEILLKHRLHDCKILLYSGRAPAQLEVLARTCGANGFVPKSETDSALALAVRTHLGG